MKITNRMNLPEPIVQACIKDYHPTPNRYGVTSLLKGATQVVLERRYHDDIVEDASDRIWALFGSAVHSILEQAEIPGAMQEMRMEVPLGGSVVSGICDLYNEKTQTVTDYKTGSCWKVIMDDWDDYKQQLMHYAWMLQENGYPCSHGEIVIFLKDHSKAKAKADRSYPQLPVFVKRFDFTPESLSEARRIAQERIQQIKCREVTPTDDLPPCKPEERWNTGDKFAVMGKGKKRALRVLDSKEEAEAYMSETGKGDFIEERPGTDKRCQDYCSVSQYGPYWRAKNEAGNRPA